MIVNLRDKLEVEDKKMRNILKKGNFSEEDDGDSDGAIDEDQEAFFSDYFIRFKTILKSNKDKLDELNELPK